MNRGLIALALVTLSLSVLPSREVQVGDRARGEGDTDDSAAFLNPTNPASEVVPTPLPESRGEAPHTVDERLAAFPTFYSASQGGSPLPKEYQAAVDAFHKACSHSEAADNAARSVRYDGAEGESVGRAVEREVRAEAAQKLWIRERNRFLTAQADAAVALTASEFEKKDPMSVRAQAALQYLELLRIALPEPEREPVRTCLRLPPL